MSELFLRDLVPIVELQALELKRLMRDKDPSQNRQVIPANISRPRLGTPSVKFALVDGVR